MANFDKKEHIKSPEDYRKIAGQVVLGHNTIYETIGTALNMDLPTQSDLLIIGGGGGKELSIFHKFSKNWDFTILDPSEKMLELAKYWSEKEGVQSRTKLLHGYLKDFDLPHSTFDGITCVSVLHYLEASERSSILQHVNKLLKSDGIFIWTVAVNPNTQNELSYLKKLYRQFPAQNGIDGKMVDKIIQTMETEYKMMTEQEELEMIRSIGFTDPIEICSSIFFKTYVVKNNNSQNNI